MTDCMTNSDFSAPACGNGNKRVLEELKKINRIKARIPMMEWELEQKRRACGSLTTDTERCAGSGSRGYRENAMDNRLIEIERLNSDIDHFRSFVKLYDDLLASLPGDERTVLQIYASGEKPGVKLERAKTALQCEKSQIYRIRSRALNRMEQVLFLQSA